MLYEIFSLTSGDSFGFLADNSCRRIIGSRKKALPCPLKKIERSHQKTSLDLRKSIERGRRMTSSEVLEKARSMFFREKQGGWVFEQRLSERQRADCATWEEWFPQCKPSLRPLTSRRSQKSVSCKASIFQIIQRGRNVKTKALHKDRIEV